MTIPNKAFSSCMGRLQYMQSANEILQMIAMGDFPSSSPLPSERFFSETLHTSRTTVRKALLLLEKMGVISKQSNGSRWIAAVRSSIPDLLDFNGFTMSCILAGHSPSTHFLSSSLRYASPEVHEFFGATYSTPLPCISRLRLIDGQPVILEENFFSPKSMYFLDSTHTDWEGSIYELLKNDHLKDALQAKRFVTSRFPDAQEKRVLRLKEKTPVLELHDYHFDKDGKPIMVSVSVSSSQRVKISFLMNSLYT